MRPYDCGRIGMVYVSYGPPGDYQLGIWAVRAGCWRVVVERPRRASKKPPQANRVSTVGSYWKWRYGWPWPGRRQIGRCSHWP